MSTPYRSASQQPGQEPGASRTPETEPAVAPPPVPDQISPAARDESGQAGSDAAASERLFSSDAGHSSRNPDATEVFRDQDLTAPPPTAPARQGADQPTMVMPAARPHPSPEPDQPGRTAMPTAYPPTYTPGQRDTQQARPAYESGLATPAHGQPIFEQDQPAYGPGPRMYEPPRQPEFQPGPPAYGQPGSGRPGHDQPNYPDDQAGTQAASSQFPPTPGGRAIPVAELPLVSRTRPSLIAGGLGLLLSLVGLYLVARYGSAAVNEFQAGTRSSNFVLATIGGLLLLVVLVLSGWSFLASLIPGLILTGLGVWALVSSTGSIRIGNAIGRLVSGFNSVNWHVLALTLFPGIVLLAVSAAGFLGRSGGKRFGRLISDRATAKRRATDGTSLDR